MTAEPIVSVEHLTVAYGAFQAVRDISFSVSAGSAFGLVGPNGAGKTSTLRVLAGLLYPLAGSVRVAGADAVAAPLDVHRRIGYMADFFGVYDFLSVTEYLEFFGGMYGMAEAELDSRMSRLLEALRLDGKRDAYVRTLSRGMKQRLYLARALIHDPPVLILDEPASGMDPRGRAEAVRLFAGLLAEGKTILISSHILDELQDLCTHIAIMEKGVLTDIRDLRQSARPEGGRRAQILTVPEDREKALAAARALPFVRDARLFERGLLVRLEEAPDCDARLLRHLLDAGVRIVLPAADKETLKDLFLDMTRDEVI